MYPEDIKDLNLFLNELQSETDRGLPLVGAALIDNKLSEILCGFFSNKESSKKLITNPNAPLGTFSSKIESCLALGLIDDFEYKEIQLIRKIRNEFAHQKHGISFNDDKIKNLCLQFKADLPLGSDHPVEDSRFKFINSVISMVMRLYYRALYVGKEKRVVKEWVSNEDVKWRSFKEENPPEGMDVLMIGKKQ